MLTVSCYISLLCIICISGFTSTKLTGYRMHNRMHEKHVLNNRYPNIPDFAIIATKTMTYFNSKFLNKTTAKKLKRLQHARVVIIFVQPFVLDLSHKRPAFLCCYRASVSSVYLGHQCSHPRLRAGKELNRHASLQSLCTFGVHNSIT